MGILDCPMGEFWKDCCSRYNLCILIPVDFPTMGVVMWVVMENIFKPQQHKTSPKPLQDLSVGISWKYMHGKMFIKNTTYDYFPHVVNHFGTNIIKLDFAIFCPIWFNTTLEHTRDPMCHRVLWKWNWHSHNYNMMSAPKDIKKTSPQTQTQTNNIYTYLSIYR